MVKTRSQTAMDASISEKLSALWAAVTELKASQTAMKEELVTKMEASYTKMKEELVTKMEASQTQMKEELVAVIRESRQRMLNVVEDRPATVEEKLVSVKEVVEKVTAVEEVTAAEKVTAVEELTAALRRKAAEGPQTPTASDHCSYDSPVNALELRFGEGQLKDSHRLRLNMRQQKHGEFLQELATDEQGLALLAYPDCPTELQSTRARVSPQHICGWDVIFACHVTYSLDDHRMHLCLPRSMLNISRSDVECVHKFARDRINVATKRMETRCDCKAMNRSFETGDLVCLWNPKRRKKYKSVHFFNRLASQLCRVPLPLRLNCPGRAVLEEGALLRICK